jgi:hypothetical protein
MPIPELNSDGLLPSGIHDCTIEEVRQRFGRFQWSDRRPNLFKQLQEYFDELQGTDIAESLIINGSFVTEKSDPNDIDLILVLRDEFSMSSPIRPFEYNLLSKRRVRRRYGFDVFPTWKQIETYQEMIDFFRQVKEKPELQKGILRIYL